MAAAITAVVVPGADESQRRMAPSGVSKTTRLPFAETAKLVPVSVASLVVTFVVAFHW